MVGRSLTRRVITWLLLGLYGLVASGLPLPFGVPLPGEPRGGDRVATARLAAKDRSRPFPCMDKPCGCATAEQCFANCCCHTPAERLAWARAHTVEPAVLARLEARVAGERPKEETQPEEIVAVEALEAPAACCCATPAAASEPAASSTSSTLASRPSCRAPLTATAAATIETETDAEEPPPRGQVVVLRAMLACGGLAAEWFALGGGGLPPPRIEFVPRAGRDEPLVAADEAPVRLATPPAAPPPRAI